MTVKADQFREAMASFATGVTVVTGTDVRGRPTGFTANAVCSVSLEPPLLLVCADRGSQSLTTLLDTGRFAVSVLSSVEGALARRFSDGARDDRFAGLDLRSESGEPPVLGGALAWFQCVVWKSFDAGDHTIVIGRVGACGAAAAGTPLVFYGGRFRTVADLPQPPDG